MKVTEGERLDGPYGTAVRVLVELEEDEPQDWTATCASWFFICPGQSPACDRYALSIIHLRPIEGVKDAAVTVPGATHEVMLHALDPKTEPVPTDPMSWRRLHPINVLEQIELPDDAAAVDLARGCARAVLAGVLPAEPLLSGAVEPWRTVLIKTAAHLRGEEHAP